MTFVSPATSPTTLEESTPTVLGTPPIPNSPSTSLSPRVDHETNSSIEDSENGGHPADSNDDTLARTSVEGEPPSAENVKGEWLCFPGSAQVKLSNGQIIALSYVRVGDRVLIGDGTFSKVIGFTHKDTDARAVFVRLHLSNNMSIEATAGHYVFSGPESKLVAMRDVRIGDVMHTMTKNGLAEDAVVQKISTVWNIGLFNAQTVSGDIVVNGVKASCYTDAIEPYMGHALLTIIRALVSAMPTTARLTVQVLELLVNVFRYAASPTNT